MRGFTSSVCILSVCMCVCLHITIYCMCGLEVHWGLTAQRTACHSASVPVPDKRNEGVTLGEERRGEDRSTKPISKIKSEMLMEVIRR